MHWLSALEGIFRSRPVDFYGALAAFLGGMTLRDRYRNLRAVRNLRQAAEAGNSEAAFQLSLKLAGRGREQQRLDWLRRAAEFARDEGRPASKVAYYLRQTGQDEQAEDTLRQAAGNGDAAAAYDLGSMLTGAGRLEEGERYYRLAAERGNRAAARYLGAAALRAGGDQDAEPYLRTAAEGGAVEDQLICETRSMDESIDAVIAEAVADLRRAGARFAYLHGSRTTGQNRADSDIDIAAYFGGRPPNSFDVLLPSGVDLLVLDDAPLELAGRVAVGGKLLFEEDQVARVRWEAMTRKIYFDELPRIARAHREFAAAVTAKATTTSGSTTTL
jgi:uncharacterized protein